MQDASWFYNLASLAGMAVILFLAWLSGGRRRPVSLKGAAWGAGLMLVLAALFFVLPGGRYLFILINGLMGALLKAARAGVQFIFGPLAIPPDEPGSLGFIFGIQALSTIVFFMALAALLYQLGIIQLFVRLFSRLFRHTLGTSGAESVGVASCILLGVESAGTVRPFLASMTRSELFCLLTAAMSTVAGTTLGIYVTTLRDTFPNIAGHLLSASIISAPAAVLVAKLMEPETGEPLTAGRTVAPEVGRYHGVMESITQGSLDGVKLLAGIAAMLISFLGLVALADGLLGQVGGLLGLEGLNLSRILGWLGWPLALVMGIPPEDAGLVGRLLGQRVIMTEIPAYANLAAMLAAGEMVYSRSALIISYALCGFAHVGSVAIFVGGYAALAPGRTGELAGLGLKALWAATLSTLLTGAVAGLFAHGGAGLLGFS